MVVTDHRRRIRGRIRTAGDGPQWVLVLVLRELPRSDRETVSGGLSIARTFDPQKRVDNEVLSIVSLRTTMENERSSRLK
jgi:hypothetical protein